MDPLFDLPTDDIKETDLQRLVDTPVSESLHCEYKRELNLSPGGKGGNKDARLEFLRDVTAFANADGGVLICGIDEQRDTNGKPTGVPSQLCGFSVDNDGALRQLIANLLRESVDEPLPGPIGMKSVSLTNGHIALVIRVPPSIRAPHMVLLGGDRGFYRRTNVDREPMTTVQIRESALQTDGALGRAHELVEHRLAAVRAMLGGRAYWALHVVPLMRGGYAVDVTRPEIIQRLRQVRFNSELAENWMRGRHALEGYQQVAESGGTGTVAMGTFFRDATVEYVEPYLLSVNNADHLYPYDHIERSAILALGSILSLYRDGFAHAPVAVFFRVGDLQGYRFLQERPVSFPSEGHPMPDRDIAPPAEIVTDLTVTPPQVLRRPFHVVWNAGGYSRCDGYDNDEEWWDYGPARNEIVRTRPSASSPPSIT